jgi:phosphoribosyl-dephospho-CoA transferase
MGPSVTIVAPVSTHDLIRLREPIAVKLDGPASSWAEPTLRRTPWVVVRRGRIRDGWLPVGVRGATRAQRCAAWLSVADIAETRSPEELWDGLANHPTCLAHARESTETEAVPAVAALRRVAPLLARLGYRWGPGGSVGFELATAVATATASSDLDIILRQPLRLDPDKARVLQVALAEAAAPARIDALLETPHGGVALTDLAAAPARVLVRTPDGPCLAADPWAMVADAQAGNVS